VEQSNLVNLDPTALAILRSCQRRSRFPSLLADHIDVQSQRVYQRFERRRHGKATGSSHQPIESFNQILSGAGRSSVKHLVFQAL